MLEALQRVTVPNKAAIIAEATDAAGIRLLQLMDIFGGVPIVTDHRDQGTRPRATRSETFDFIESELLDARADLPDSWPASATGASPGRRRRHPGQHVHQRRRVHEGNRRGRCLGPTTRVSGCTVTGGVDACQAAINCRGSASSIPGVYTPGDRWRSNFTADNQTSPENIMVVKFLNKADLGMNFVMRSLHYTQFDRRLALERVRGTTGGDL